MKAVLVANRGEIAVRIIRSIQELGLRAVAVYSDADREALHVRLADEALNIGPPVAAGSYLAIDRILDAAVRSNADAVHPGYGFLAENPDFARRIEEAGLVFIGPSAQAIAVMGDKIEARRAAERVGVRPVPGTLQPVADADAVRAVAREIGYSLALKATHGGGGKGLRVVHDDGELDRALESAQREAAAYFGDPEMYVERYLARPRHIEAQILFDNHGTGVFLGERDCSTQRRHQKLIEETPAPNLPAGVRDRIGEAALAVAQAAGYRNAGTVEFLVEDDGSVWFLEMNTRLQVEHTITEMVTGIDIVKEQLRLAAGEPLTLDRIERRGHAFEFRINAEDPARGFLPSPGTITAYREPGGFGVRVDSGVTAGGEVSRYYDTLIAKLVVWGADRSDAISRSKRALREYLIEGVATTIPAHLLLLDHPDLAGGHPYTRFVEERVSFDALAAAPEAVTADGADPARSITVEVDGRRFDVRVWGDAGAPAAAAPATRSRTRSTAAPGGATQTAGVVRAPMQGTIVKLLVAVGDTVGADQPVCILEAMKMENIVKAGHAGRVEEIRVAAGDSIGTGGVLAVIR